MLISLSVRWPFSNVGRCEQQWYVPGLGMCDEMMRFRTAALAADLGRI
jgi:hypothetical protein